MKILITGGNGFIGANLIIKLLKYHRSVKILNIDCNTYASNFKYLKFLNQYKNYNYKNVNINNFRLLSKNFLDFNPDVLINLAAETHVDNSINNATSFIKTNILGTYNLLEISKNFVSCGCIPKVPNIIGSKLINLSIDLKLSVVVQIVKIFSMPCFLELLIILSIFDKRGS